MRVLILSLMFMASLGVLLAQGIRPNEELVLGTKLPNVKMVDTDGKVFSLYELKGRCLILSPIYMSCPSACIAITNSLKKAIEKVGGLGEDYIVLSFSFNPDDGLDEIRQFHRDHPIRQSAWRLAYVPEDKSLFGLLDSIDFRFTYVNKEILDHPNLILFLDKNCVVRHYEYGTDYQPVQIQRGLRIARGELTLSERLMSKDIRPKLMLFALILGIGWFVGSVKRNLQCTR